MRSREVSVGQHVAPAASSVPGLLHRWGGLYAGVCRGGAALVALAAAHQRLGWIHPFVDGNGRVMRLHTHSVLHALGYTGGVWSPLRGFARTVDRYYALLAAADEPRRGDLHGRGALSESALVDWIDYVLDTCMDQVQFMTGLGDRTAVTLVTALVKRGLLRSDSPQGKVRFGLPMHALRFYFPALWPEAEADAATTQPEAALTKGDRVRTV